MKDEAAPTQHVPRRVRLAQGLAFVALVGGLVGAVGPAERASTTYTWPPEISRASPSRTWYTPLLLQRRTPRSLTASLPCSQRPALPSADRPVTVLATARSPEQAGGLAVRQQRDGLDVLVGDSRLPRLPLSPEPANGDGCLYQLSIADRRWSISGGPIGTKLDGGLDEMPVVNGLFSEIDLAAGGGPTIEVRTETHGTRSAPHQRLAWILSVLAAGAALLLIAAESRGRRPRPAIGRLVGDAARGAKPVDAVVGLALVVWLVIGPAFWDDGFVIAREQMFTASGGFSHYYAAFGTNLPLDYWLDWTHHWLTQSSTSLLVLRLPALLFLALTWLLCRWVLARVLARGRGAADVALWALGCAFLTLALAWGMTLRPEPVTALFAAAVMACTLLFLERESAAPLVLAAILVPLALTAHHTGVVALAPLLAAAPAVLGWARTQVPVAVALVSSSIALLSVLAFVGSDIEGRRADAELTSAYGLGASWREEPARYFLLSAAPYGTTLRRASVALIVLAAIAFVARARRSGDPRQLRFPGSTLLVALALLVLTPSKWPWHFGALLAIASVAVAAESARVRDEARESRRWSLWPFLAVGAASVAVAWSWWPRTLWGKVDLRTLDWTPDFESWLPVPQLATALPLVVLLGALVHARVTRAPPLPAVPWRVASWAAPLVAAPLIVFTAAVLVADTAKTPGWTLARQNLGTLWRGQGCGLADDLAVADLRSVAPLAVAAGSKIAPEPTWAPSPPVAELPRLQLAPDEDARAETPWFRLPAGRRAGLFVSGTPRSSDRLALEWGRLDGAEVVLLGDAALRADLTSDVGAGVADWRFLAAAELPDTVPEATVARVTLRADYVPGAAVAVTPLVAYGNRSLAEQLDSGGSRALVLADVLTYFPCVRQPRLRNGVAEVPERIVTTASATHPLEYPGTSPFEGVLDVYRLTQLPVADSPNPPEIVVFAIDRGLPGAKLLPPVERAST